MLKYGFSLSRVLAHKDRIGRIWVIVNNYLPRQIIVYWNITPVSLNAFLDFHLGKYALQKRYKKFALLLDRFELLGPKLVVIKVLSFCLGYYNVHTFH